MMIVRPNTTGIKTYKPDSNELETYIKIIKVDNKTANVQIEKLLLSTKYSSIRAICGRHCEERELMNEKIINRRLYFNLLKIYP